MVFLIILPLGPARSLCNIRLMVAGIALRVPWNGVNERRIGYSATHIQRTTCSTRPRGTCEDPCIPIRRLGFKSVIINN